MDRWINKVAVVTGASSGIGAYICKDLVQAGMIVVGLARRKERVNALRAKIRIDAPGKLHAVCCDVSCDAEIVRAFEWIEEELGAIHVFINNAGITRMGSITREDSCETDLRDTLQTNLWGSIQCTRKAVEIMKRKHVIGAHVILVNSIVGHASCVKPNKAGTYAISKFGVTSLAEVLRQEFNADGLQYKVTSISPGTVKTEIVDAAIFAKIKHLLYPEDVSQAVMFVLATPPHVQIQELTIKAVGEIY